MSNMSHTRKSIGALAAIMAFCLIFAACSTGCGWFGPLPFFDPSTPGPVLDESPSDEPVGTADGQTAPALPTDTHAFEAIPDLSITPVATPKPTPVSVPTQLPTPVPVPPQPPAPDPVPTQPPAPTPIPAKNATHDEPQPLGRCDEGIWMAGLVRSPELTRDCEVLLEIRDALSGEANLNWNIDVPIRGWDGVGVGSHPTRVDSINLERRGLTGVIPPALGRLDGLEFLILPLNRLTGAIPPELSNLSDLRTLDLSTNRLSGTIPAELSVLTKLTYLNVAVNRLTGPIPSEIANLSRMTRFDAGQNWLTGKLPSELAKLSNLRELLLGSNLLSGEVPTQLIDLTNLDRLDLARNEFNGCVPDELRVRDANIGSMRFCGEPSPEWTHRPLLQGGVDLGVAYIERSPRYLKYKLSYPGVRGYCPYPFDEFKGPVYCPEPSEVKRWPYPGQPVELVAHVWNFGDTASGPFEYQWAMDGKTLENSFHAGLSAGEHTTFELGLDWPSSDSNPVVTFSLDEDDDIPELIEFNNEIADWIKGYTLGFSFMPPAYENLRRLHWGERLIYSPEHYVHRHISQLNQLLAGVGLQDRVRAGLLIVSEERFAWEHHPTHLYLDGWWPLWDDKPLFTRHSQRHPDISWGLIHELLHQLGVIDLYQMEIGRDMMEVPDANRPGRLAGCGEEYWGDHDACFRFDKDISDVMVGLSPFIGAHTAGGLASNLGYRRGYYGEYLFDTPRTTLLRVVDQNGNALPSVDLRFYQLEEQVGGRKIDAVPEFVSRTNERGIAVLPNRGITGVVTETDHQLRPNPFGVISVVGLNGLFLIEMEGRCTNYEWLTVVDLNLAYWEGFTEEATIDKTLKCPPP